MINKYFKTAAISVVAALSAVSSFSANAILVYSEDLHASVGEIEVNPNTTSWNNVSLDYDVYYDFGTNLWTYEYTWSGGDGHNISHFTVEVTDGDEGTKFTTDNLEPGTSGGVILGDWAAGDSGEPGLPNDFYGLKFDSDPQPVTYTIVTDRAPMWGDFYAKNGKEDGYDLYAYNVGFDTGNGDDVNFTCEPDGCTFVDGTIDLSGEKILVPNSSSRPPQYVPVPAAVWLFGSGLLGMVGVARRRKTA